MTQPTPASATGPAIPWPVFAVTVTGAFMVALDLSIVNVAFPSIEESFPDVSTASLSWVLTAYSVVFGALLLGAGRVADRSGRRRWFVRGLVIFTIGSALCAFAPAVWLLIGGRVSRFRSAWLMCAAAAMAASAISAFQAPRQVVVAELRVAAVEAVPESSTTTLVPAYRRQVGDLCWSWRRVEPGGVTSSGDAYVYGGRQSQGWR